MRIGVDIDDTITDSWTTFYKEYAKAFGVHEEDILKEKPYYNSIVKEKFTLEEYVEKVRPINDKFNPYLPLKENVKEVIDKLYELGHSITFITARGVETTNAYEVTKHYLDSHNIRHEKLILAPLDKAKACLDENIDLFIDDSIKHCTNVSNAGVEVLMFETKYNKECTEFNHVINWNEIYENIKSR